MKLTVRTVRHAAAATAVLSAALSIPSVAQAEAVRAGLGGPVTFTVIDGAPHASNVTHPEQVNKAVLNFLKGLDE